MLILGIGNCNIIRSVCLPFELLQDDTLYRESAPNPNGYWVNRQWVLLPNTFVTFSGIWSPYREGETSITLPEGVSSSDSIVINTLEVLATANSSIGNESTAARIYIEDPEVNTNAEYYIIRKAEIWKANSSFSLIPSYNEYIAERHRAT